MISNLAIKLHKAQQLWLEIKNERFRRRNTALRVGTAGLAILETVIAESAQTSVKLIVTTADGAEKTYFLKSGDETPPYGYGYGYGIIGEI